MPLASDTLAATACAVLRTAAPAEKAALARAMAEKWPPGSRVSVGSATPPPRPARPDRPTLAPPTAVPKRGKGLGPKGRIALLHALAHIEFNAIDLACDIIARFAGDALPDAFFTDWARVAGEEAKHFGLLSARLTALGAAYGDLPAHDGLWDAAAETAHDLLARLAVVPLVLEARGLDVTPAMIDRLRKAGDNDSATVLETIYRDEIGHVAIGQRWFDRIARGRGLDPVAAYHDLFGRHFRGALKPPFNRAARDAAGLAPAYYAPLAAGATDGGTL